MKRARQRRIRTLFAAVAIVAAIATLVARLSRMSKDRRPNIGTSSQSQQPAQQPAQQPSALPTAGLPVQPQNSDVQPPQVIAPPFNNTSPTVPGASLPS